MEQISTVWSLMERLAAGLAYHTINGGLTYELLSGGAETNLAAVGVSGQPAAAVEGGVFTSVAVCNIILMATRLLQY